MILVSVSSRSYILSYPDSLSPIIQTFKFVSVSSRSYILSYLIRRKHEKRIKNSFRLLSELYSLL